MKTIPAWNDADPHSDNDWIDAVLGQMRAILYIAACMLFALWAGSLMGCATFEAPSYWYPRAQQQEYKGTLYAALPDGLWGHSYGDGIIVVSTSAPSLLWDCIEKHEKTELTHWHYPQQLGGVWCDLTTFVAVPQTAMRVW